MPLRFDLNALIASRICHDLISPIGAIGNGLELMMLTNGPQSPEYDLISSSANQATARLRFFRLAFGWSGNDLRIGRGEIEDILKDMWGDSRSRISWDSGNELSRREVKLACLLILCLESAMPWGGDIQVSNQRGIWHIRAEARRLKFNQPMWQMLQGAPIPAEIDPAEVQFALALHEARRMDVQVAANLGDETAVITFSAKP